MHNHENSQYEACVTILYINKLIAKLEGLYTLKLPLQF